MPNLDVQASAEISHAATVTSLLKDDAKEALAPNSNAAATAEGEGEGEGGSLESSQQQSNSSSNCLFVANLPSSFSDDELEHHLRSLFARYGQIRSTKASRDKKLRPYCFVQFEGAVNSEVFVQPHYLGGRPLRVEASRGRSGGGSHHQHHHNHGSSNFHHAMNSHHMSGGYSSMPLPPPPPHTLLVANHQQPVMFDSYYSANSSSSTGGAVAVEYSMSQDPATQQEGMPQTFAEAATGSAVTFSDNSSAMMADYASINAGGTTYSYVPVYPLMITNLNEQEARKGVLFRRFKRFGYIVSMDIYNEPYVCTDQSIPPTSASTSTSTSSSAVVVEGDESDQQSSQTSSLGCATAFIYYSSYNAVQRAVQACDQTEFLGHFITCQYAGILDYGCDGASL